ncbi:MAG: hypothetical protein JRI25_18870 [Deltaproteobacteria bacterium]|nr:hypothetical protein [Deltaproteobacteria bacterium]MBW2256640.1 hypothetical protein [Deltaproteobacteria bacterium]
MSEGPGTEAGEGTGEESVLGPMMSSWKPDVEPEWSKTEAKSIQRQLKRLGLYKLGIDGAIGKGSKAGLVEAFGSDEWRMLGAADVLTKLKAAKTPKSKADKYRYGEMFKDGVLDLTIGIGYDEDDNHLDAILGFEEVLAARDFEPNAGARAAELYTQAGRTVEKADFGQYYVKENALMYTPPVGGPPRPIHAVVRLVFSHDGKEGKKAADAFKEGMAESDVAYYSGHGRYGSGPDFDRNMTFDLKDAEGNVEQHIEDYTVLKKVLAKEGKARSRGPWAQFMWRVNKKRIEVNGDNEGNVFLNPKNKHSKEFGARLMYWNLERTGKGAKLQTGKDGPLDKALDSEEARKYRIVVFDGCRTKDYLTAVRGTPGMKKDTTDIAATRRSVDWGDEANTLAEFLDGIIGQQSKESIIKDMDSKQSPSKKGGKWGGAYGSY